MHMLVAALGISVTPALYADQCLTLQAFWHSASAEQMWVHDCAEGGWKGGGTDCCKYYGVTCDKTGAIVALNLNGCGIKGGTFGDLLTLPTLVNISFAGNELHGSFPSKTTKTLEILELYSNKLSGKLTALVGATSLTIADLHHFNEFSGPLPLMPETLGYISVANNHLTGSIPHQWANLKNLGTIGLAYNMPSGGLSSLAPMAELKVIFLRNNSPTGALPAVPMGLGALHIDANHLIDLDMRSICASAPAGGWHKGGCAAVSTLLF
jgi:hypothetical protein